MFTPHILIAILPCMSYEGEKASICNSLSNVGFFVRREGGGREGRKGGREG